MVQPHCLNFQLLLVLQVVWSVFTFLPVQISGRECYQCLEFDSYPSGISRSVTKALLEKTLNRLPVKRIGYLEFDTTTCPWNKPTSRYPYTWSFVSTGCHGDSICIVANVSVTTSLNASIDTDVWVDFSRARERKAVYEKIEVQSSAIIRGCASRNFILSKKETFTKLYDGEGNVASDDAVESGLIGETYRDYKYVDAKTKNLVDVVSHSVSLVTSTLCEYDNCNNCSGNFAGPYAIIFGVVVSIFLGFLSILH